MKHNLSTGLIIALCWSSCMSLPRNSPCAPQQKDEFFAASMGDSGVTAADVQEARCLVFQHGGINGYAMKRMTEFSDYSVTPLAYAAAQGKLGVLKVLLAQGADFNAPTTNESRSVVGYTLLHWAANNGRVEVVRYLLSKGADPNAKDKETRSVLQVAMGFINPYEDADRCKIAKLLIAHGANVNSKTDWNLTPLHWASSVNAPETVEFLLLKGANPNAVDKNGFTPLRHAIRRPSPPYAVIRVLRQYGAHL